MKTTLGLFIAIAMIATGLMACSKNDTSTPASSDTGSFTERGAAFTVPTGTTYSQYINDGSTQNQLAVEGFTKDNKRAIVSIGFYGKSKPAAGSYKIVDGVAGLSAANQISVAVIDSLSVSQQGFLISTDNSSPATIAIDGSGKISVTLPSTTIKGNNNDWTNPSSAVSTTVTTTISGTIKQQ
jgi:hypothetical protein